MKATKKSNTKAERAAATEAAFKSGKTWAQRFIELVRENPKDYRLQGWIQDVEMKFEGNPRELNDFYMTIQQACMGKTAPGRNDCVLSDDDYDSVQLDLGIIKDLVDVVNEEIPDDSRGKTVALLLFERIEKADATLSAAWKKTKQKQEAGSVGVSHG